MPARHSSSWAVVTACTPTRSRPVSSQADSERADLFRERVEIGANRASEQNELAGMYVKRGLQPALAVQVAEQLMAYDALEAHSRDELGISDTSAARSVQAALISAAAFALGAALPLAVALVAPGASAVVAIAASSLVFLALLGAVGAKIGGANMLKAAVRVTFWGAPAMAVTAAIGSLFGTQV